MTATATARTSTSGSSRWAPRKLAKLRASALRWFDRHRRHLPWRSTRDPYRIWVSEIMLQQTQVATVIPYYEKFIKRFPDVATLAAADEPAVLRLWEGLGYYRRARQLHRAAKYLQTHNKGVCPETLAGWMQLPGIGRYTAGAILSISSDQRLPILEANTTRLFARLLALRGDLRTPRRQAQLWAFAESILPNKRAGDFNQALMDIGSQVCLPAEPRCPECPLRSLCRAFQLGKVNSIPVPASRIQLTDVDQDIVVIVRRRKVLLRLGGPGKRWEGLWDVPRFERSKSSRPIDLATTVRRQTGLQVTVGPAQFRMRHGVTRYRMKLYGHLAEAVQGGLSKEARKDWRWHPIDSLAELPLNITARKVLVRCGIAAPAN